MFKNANKKLNLAINIENTKEKNKIKVMRIDLVCNTLRKWH